jgi:hypothetical protein
MSQRARAVKVCAARSMAFADDELADGCYLVAAPPADDRREEVLGHAAHRPPHLVCTRRVRSEWSVEEQNRGGGKGEERKGTSRSTVSDMYAASGSSTMGESVPS